MAPHPPPATAEGTQDPLRILLVEDSENDALLVIRTLQKGGVSCSWERVDTAEALRSQLERSSWDLVIADWNLPSFNALQALAMVRATDQDIPFIIASGTIGEEQAVAAMKAGAHDYVRKDNLARLVPAVDRELREAVERRGRREAVQGLKTQFEQIMAIFDSMQALVYVSDMETRALLFINRAGGLAGDLVGRPCHEVLHDSPTPCPFCTNDKLLVDGIPGPPHIWEYEEKETGRWYQCIDRAIRWPDGRLVRLEIAVDITERKNMEQMKEEMLSAVSHEMRTPLTAILGFTDYLLTEETSPEQTKSCLTTIYRETERLNELIGNFLELQRLKARAEQPPLRPVPVPELLDFAVQLFRGASRHHHIRVDCRADTPPVLGNRDQLHELLANLLSNAIKYSPDGGEVMVRSENTAEGVVLSVRDQGIGIPAPLLERIFDKFYRVDNSDRRRMGGTGLGLTLVKEIVLVHGGRVWVESTPGAGSTFFVLLRRAGDFPRHAPPEDAPQTTFAPRSP
jgi:signal transduction histidine kinase